MENRKMYQTIFYFIPIVFNYIYTKIYLIIIKKLKIKNISEYIKQFFNLVSTIFN